MRIESLLRGIYDTGQTLVQGAEFVELHLEFGDNGRRYLLGLPPQGAPPLGEGDREGPFILLARSRWSSPEASSRLSNGDRVPGSSRSSRLSSATETGSCCHSASITRYCGWVSPIGSSIGR